MTTVFCDMSVSFFILIIFQIVIKFSYGNPEINEIDLQSLVFEQFKNSIFENNRVSDEFMLPNDLECLNELQSIGNGLKNIELWAITMVDAWGKIPSGIMEGNLFELGSYPECFNIEKDNVPYNTKYCFAQLKLDSNRTKSWLEQEPNHHELYDVFFPKVLQMDEESVPPSIILPRSQNGFSVSLGICLPSICSMDFLQSYMNMTGGYLSVKLDEQTCQLEESASTFESLDWVTCGILGTVGLLIVISTSYDLICAMNNRKRSKILLAFSFYTNACRLFSYRNDNSSDSMLCLNGIRAISTQWVVLGHTFAMYMMLPARNTAALEPFIAKYHNMILISALIAVDSFFVMSGILVSINLLKHLEKTKGTLNIPMLHLHRYLRLTPLFAVCILFSISLLKFLGNGPVWHNHLDGFVEPCKTYWWSALLYVQNYVNPQSTCYGPSWYLSVDMQLFVIAPFILLLIHRFQTKAIFGLVMLILYCVASTIFVHVKYGYKGMFTKMDKIYTPTHYRYSSWLIGVICGYIQFKMRNKPIQIPRLLNLFGWFMSLSIMGAIIFASYPLVQLDSKNTPLHYGLYDGLSRVGWAISLCYIIFACVHGFGGPVNWFLSHPVWQPISRVSYSTYLLHVPVIFILMATVKTSIYFTELSAFHTFIGNSVITVFISIFATLAFESPIMVLEKFIFSSKIEAKPVTQLRSVVNKNNLECTSSNI